MESIIETRWRNRYERSSRRDLQPEKGHQSESHLPTSSTPSTKTVTMEHSLFTLVSNIVTTWMMATTFLLAAGYLFLSRRYKYWEARGIPGPKPAMLFGSLKDALFMKNTESEVLTFISEKYKDEKYVGIYHLWKPVILVKDVELAKKVMERDFDHFTDHPDITGKVKTDSVLDSLVAMQGDVWRSRRGYFSKLFTPKKLKEYAEDMLEGLKVLMNEMEEHAKSGKDVDTFRAFEPYAIYSVTSTMYGLNVIKDEERTNILKKLTHFFMHPPAQSAIKFICYGINPKLFKFLRLRTLPTWHWDYSAKLTDELVSWRSTSAVVRNDCLTMVMKLLAEGAPDIKKITYEEAVGHIFSFLQAGTHTTQTAMCHVLHRLAHHPDVQDKLRAEVDSFLNGSDHFTFEDLKSMTYLDNVLTESQRLCPLLGCLKRTCTKPYKIDDKLTLPERMDVYIDVAYMHMDAKYFPEPEKFLPERWTNGQSEPSAFMTFGRGPRMCIGKRFAEVEMKIAVATIVSRYIVLPSEKMKPMKFDPQTLFLTNIPVDGIWVKLKHRDDKGRV